MLCQSGGLSFVIFFADNQVVAKQPPKNASLHNTSCMKSTCEKSAGIATIYYCFFPSAYELFYAVAPAVVSAGHTAQHVKVACLSILHLPYSWSGALSLLSFCHIHRCACLLSPRLPPVAPQGASPFSAPATRLLPRSKHKRRVFCVWRVTLFFPISGCANFFNYLFRRDCA